MQILIIFGGGGGIVALVTAVLVVGRGIFKQVSATEDNTEAVTALSGEVKELSGKLNGHAERIAVLEDRVKRP